MVQVAAADCKHGRLDGCTMEIRLKHAQTFNTQRNITSQKNSSQRYDTIEHSSEVRIFELKVQIQNS